MICRFLCVYSVESRQQFNFVVKYFKHTFNYIHLRLHTMRGLSVFKNKPTFFLSVPLYATRMPQLINRKQVERPNSCRLWGKFRAHKNETWIFLGRQWGCGGRRRMRKKKRGKNKSNRRKKKCNKTSELLERDAPGQTVRERKEESERKQNNKAEY